MRRGLYALAPPHARERPDPLVAASRLHRPSYVSLQSALECHGVIPEAVPIITSVTTRRPRRFKTPFGEFVYRHVHPGLFWGYQGVEIGTGQEAYVAFPEKALLDLLYLTPGPVRRRFLTELRFSSGQLDPVRLEQFARRTKKPKLIRAASLAARLLRDEAGKEATL